MSGKHEEIICPNCGHHAMGNYCAQCGQPTHLHNETFGGLILHFIGHYFHYDSKFWQTLKALWFSPGKLTIAYWNKQRMRYIAPISLYIFISAVYFLASSLMPNKYVKINTNPTTDSASTGRHFNFSKNYSGSIIDLNIGKPKNSEERYKQEEVKERFFHNVPKVFFFMIPLMAFVLYLLFVKRKELTYVNHIIFALHYHSFWFSILLMRKLYFFEKGTGVLMLIIFLLSAIYFIAALRNVYKVSWVRSALYGIITGLVYFIFAITALALLSIILFT